MERNLQRVRNKGQEDCARPFTSPDDLQLSTGSERGHDVHGSLEFERKDRIYEVQNVSTRRGDTLKISFRAELEPCDPGQTTAMAMNSTDDRANRNINRFSLILHIFVYVPEMLKRLLQDEHSSSRACWMMSNSFLHTDSSSSLCEFMSESSAGSQAV
jgi:hypothetical protein